MVLLSGPDPAGVVCDAILTRARTHLPELKGVDLPPDALRTSPRVLVDLLARLTHASGKTPVFILDQLEEVFTQNPRGSQRIADLFELTRRLAYAQAVPFKLVFAFRTEFRGDFYPLEERLGRCQRSVALRGLSESALVDVIEGPSRLESYGFRYQDGFAPYLAREIVRTTRDARDALLPVLQIVCRQLYDCRRQSASDTIGKELYERILGGVEQVLKRHVEERLRSPEYPHRGEIARRMLKELTIKEGGDRYARPRDEEDLLAFPDRQAARQTLERLVGDHLVVRLEDREGRAQVRLASEVICPLVEGWALEASDVDRACRVLSRTFRQWEDGGRRSDDLLSGSALALVCQNLVAISGLSAGEQEFVRASGRRRLSRRISFSVILAAIALVTSGLIYRAYFKPGYLELDSEPRGAQVFLGDRLLAKTPLSWRLRPGMYTLKLTTARYDPIKIDVKIPAGGSVDYRPILRYPYGIMAVGSDPAGATCEIRRLPCSARDKPLIVRKTPFTMEVPTGRYRLDFSLPARVPRSVPEVVVRANRELCFISVPLAKNTGYLLPLTPDFGGRVNVFPNGATTPIMSGTMPLTAPMELPVGDYRIEFVTFFDTRAQRRAHISRGATEELFAWLPGPAYLWLSPIVEGPVSAPVLGDLDRDGTLDAIVGLENGQVYAVDGTDGSLLWKYATGDEVHSRAALADLDGDGTPDVVVGSLDRKVHAISGKNGTSLWRFATEGQVHSSPATADLDSDGVADVVVGSRDNNLYALSAVPNTPRPLILRSIEEDCSGTSDFSVGAWSSAI